MVERVDEFKAKLLDQFLGELDGPSSHLLRRALGEAEALAWLTSFPQLFLPMLAEEKVQDLRAWQGRQQQIRARGEIITTTQTKQ